MVVDVEAGVLQMYQQMVIRPILLLVQLDKLLVLVPIALMVNLVMKVAAAVEAAADIHLQPPLVEVEVEEYVSFSLLQTQQSY